MLCGGGGGGGERKNYNNEEDNDNYNTNTKVKSVVLTGKFSLWIEGLWATGPVPFVASRWAGPRLTSFLLFGPIVRECWCLIVWVPADLPTGDKTCHTPSFLAAGSASRSQRGVYGTPSSRRVSSSVEGN